MINYESDNINWASIATEHFNVILRKLENFNCWDRSLQFNFAMPPFFRRLSGVTPADEDTYICEAVNVVGTARANATLTVYSEYDVHYSNYIVNN